MENKDEQELKVETEVKTNKNFALFGKVVLILLVFGLLGSGAYYLGTKSSQTTSPTPTPTPLSGITGTPTQPTVTIFTQAKQKISAGVGDYKFSGVIPDGWTFKTNSDPSVGTSETTIVNGAYSLIIRQSPRGVGSCSYPDAPAPTHPEFTNPMTFTKYVQFNGTSGEVFRRQDITANESAGVSFHGICQKSENENFYQNYTRFGEISYEAPLNNPSETMLKELDAIVATFKKQ